jgi:hypothetical protein
VPETRREEFAFYIDDFEVAQRDGQVGDDNVRPAGLVGREIQFSKSIWNSR